MVVVVRSADEFASPMLLERVALLEQSIADLTMELQPGNVRLRKLRLEAKKAREHRDSVATKALEAQRGCRIARSLLADAEARVRVERSRRERHEGDNKGLVQTLRRLQARVQSARETSSYCREAVAKEEDAWEGTRVEEESLESAISGMDGPRRALEVRVAAQRARSLQLQASAKAKFQRIEQATSELQRHVDAHEQEVAELTAEAETREIHAQQARNLLQVEREAALRSISHVQELDEARREMHRELVQVRQNHEKLRGERDSALSQLGEMNNRKTEDQREWRMRHLERLDTFLDARRRADKDIVIAVA
eukprot:TRINITY_DN69307_c0_g1_i1.p1 TRINITY_DN69307_c0_g1~~TRINITY_DN69307_c0_g1_i1.p1  ORF type:complete len:358 (-),score=64.11 TRINITY_DN69307_c0_g1_i1:98-1030(-)